MNEKMNPIYDLVGIGIGPFNLGLAALAEPLNPLRTIFFDKNPSFEWHPGLLLNDSHLQVPFFADLVTLANPIHPLSFLNYLHHHKRMYKFYFRQNFHISRREYNHYCQWVCSQLSNLHFNHHVTEVERISEKGKSVLRVTVNNHNDKKVFYAKHIAVGVGTEPYIPEKLRTTKNNYIQHSAYYLNYHQQFRLEKSVCVVGSGQSAAEIVLEMLKEFEHYPRQITWVTRSRGFFPMEYSKLGLEHFSPDYANYFYQLSEEERKKTLAQQDLLYKGISQQTIAEIFDRVYQLTIANQISPLTLFSHSELEDIKEINGTHRFKLHFNQWQMKKNIEINCDAVILATGYQTPQLKFLSSIAHDLITDTHQSYALSPEFSTKTKHPFENKIFMQNNSLSSHGVGSADLGLGCYRNSVILNSISEKEYYPVNNNNVFQSFLAG